MDYISQSMQEQDLKVLRLKAEAFDRLVKRYRTLQLQSGFYSKNWLEIEQLIESALENLRLLKQGKGPDLSDPS